MDTRWWTSGLIQDAFDDHMAIQVIINPSEEDLDSLKTIKAPTPRNLGALDDLNCWRQKMQKGGHVSVFKCRVKPVDYCQIP
jgi:hypothetical protein